MGARTETGVYRDLAAELIATLSGWPSEPVMCDDCVVEDCYCGGDCTCDDRIGKIVHDAKRRLWLADLEAERAR